MRSREEGRSEWVQGHLAEAARIATLLTADPVRGPVVAEEAMAAALQLVSPRRRDGKLADVLLAQLVRRSRDGGPGDTGSRTEQIVALRSIPRRQRAALVLCHYAELSEDRAAVFLGCSPRAVADLVARATQGLPTEALADLHEWLDSTPLPRAAGAAARRPWLRRIFSPRLLRTAGTIAAVAMGIVAGIQLPKALDEPERPTREERLAEIRRVLETREASLPFDPDDPGPGSSPMFRVVDGVVGGNLWSVTGYRDRTGRSCLQIVVDYDFGRRRCLGSSTDSIEAVVDVDRADGATFVTGTVAPDVDSLYFVGPGVSFMDVTIGRRNGRADPEPGYFGIALGDEYVTVDSRAVGRIGGFEVFPARLTGTDAGGRRVARLTMFLART